MSGASPDVPVFLAFPSVDARCVRGFGVLNRAFAASGTRFLPFRAGAGPALALKCEWIWGSSQPVEGIWESSVP